MYMNLNISEQEVREQALEFMRKNDIYPRDERDAYLVIDDELHRYALETDRHGETTGAYVIHSDGFPAGYFQNWRTGFKQNWKFPRSNLTQEQRNIINSPEFKKKEKELQAQREKQAEDRERERKAGYEKAAERARILFDSYIYGDALMHPYLYRKDVKLYGARLDTKNKKIAIPLRDVDGKLWSIQWIDENGSKQFFPKATTAGAFFSMGLDKLSEQNNVLLLAEGFATAAKLYEQTGYPTIAAMTCGGFERVAQDLRRKYPFVRIVVMADDDKGTEQKTGVNPGIKAAMKLKEKGLAVGYAFPPFEEENIGTDWDDYELHYGASKTHKVLWEMISYELLSEEEKAKRQKKERLDEVVHELDPSIQLPPQEFIGGLFPRKFITLLAAPPGTGKTIFIQKSASDLSLGGTFFDGVAENEPPRKCLIFAGEAGYELLLRRGASLKWPINPKNVKVVDQHEFEYKDIAIALDEEEGWKNVELLMEMYSPDLVIWDTFSSFHDKDENKAVEMKPIIKKIARLADEKNLAVVLVHHSRKRAASERNLSLNQDDVIGSSIFNRLVSLIIGIEPMKDDEKTLLVRPLKTWFSAFMPFTYKLTQDFYGHTTMETNLAPEGINNVKSAFWNYLVSAFQPGEWFSFSQIIVSEIDAEISERQIRNLLESFLKMGKLSRRGAKKYIEYSITSNYKN